MILQPASSVLAGVLVVSKKLMMYEDAWRHKSNICLEITLDNYINFLLENQNLISFFYIKDLSLIKMYTEQKHLSQCLKIYPYFVIDVTMAYIAEIIDAAKNQKEVTDIFYKPPIEDFKHMKALRLPNVASFEIDGKKLVLEMEAKGMLPHVSLTKEIYKQKFKLCLITLGYSLFVLNNPRNFIWKLN